MDTTFGDICKCELLTELGLRVIEVQSSAPVMWIIPSQRIHQGFPVTISHDLHPATASSVSLPMRTPPPPPTESSKLSPLILCVTTQRVSQAQEE